MFLITTCLIPVLLFGINSIVHIIAYNKQIETVTIFNYYPPIYAPMRDSLKGPMDSIDPETRKNNLAGNDYFSNSDSGHILNYPLAKPEFNDNSDSKKTILLILLESWRADTLTYDIMPNVYKFAQMSTNFNKHISSGNITFCGLFGLFYGVHCGMFYVAKNNPYTYRSIFSKSLFDNGYKINIYTNSSIKRYQVKTMMFDDAKIENIHNDGTDKDLVESLINDIKNNDPKELNFYFLFLTSSHYPFKSDPNYRIYDDVAVQAEKSVAIDTAPEIESLKKIYLNSLHYEDYLLGDVFNALREKGTMDDIWIIVSGDHGEEFNDTGNLVWGHGKDVNSFQTKVPMLIKKPFQTQKEEIDYISLHQDFAPTIMEEILKTKNLASDYSNGTNIFNITYDRATVAHSYFESGYIFDNIGVDSLTGRKYSWDTGQTIHEPLTREEKEKIKQLFNEELKFLKKY
jgi:membrane-anchored protein YejM (alkaline phosphatase superfamily)